MGRPRRGGAGPANEIFAARKDWGAGIRVALVYPNRYAAGMSNLGFLLIYARINARTDALCERVFLSGDGRRRAPPQGRGTGAANSPTEGRTLESGRPLSSFDVVAVSLSYENDLLNVPAILAAGGVPRSGRIVPPPAAGTPSLSPAGSPRRSIPSRPESSPTPWSWATGSARWTSCWTMDPARRGIPAT